MRSGPSQASPGACTSTPCSKNGERAGKLYSVALVNREAGCTCPDAEVNGATCKHVMALRAIGFLPVSARTAAESKAEAARIAARVAARLRPRPQSPRRLPSPMGLARPAVGIRRSRSPRPCHRCHLRRRHRRLSRGFVRLSPPMSPSFRGPVMTALYHKKGISCIHVHGWITQKWCPHCRGAGMRRQRRD